MTGMLRLGLDALQGAQVALALADEGLDLREVVERLGEAFRAGLQGVRELDLLVLDLLLEERGHDDGASPGGFQPRRHCPGHGSGAKRRR